VYVVGVLADFGGEDETSSVLYPYGGDLAVVALDPALPGLEYPAVRVGGVAAASGAGQVLDSAPGPQGECGAGRVGRCGCGACGVGGVGLGGAGGVGLGGAGGVGLGGAGGVGLGGGEVGFGLGDEGVVVGSGAG
jgi:hypothetical protein